MGRYRYTNKRLRTAGHRTLCEASCCDDYYTCGELTTCMATYCTAEVVIAGVLASGGLCDCTELNDTWIFDIPLGVGSYACLAGEEILSFSDVPSCGSNVGRLSLFMGYTLADGWLIEVRSVGSAGPLVLGIWVLTDIAARDAIAALCAGEEVSLPPFLTDDCIINSSTVTVSLVACP